MALMARLSPCDLTRSPYSGKSGFLIVEPASGIWTICAEREGSKTLGKLQR